MKDITLNSEQRSKKLWNRVGIFLAATRPYSSLDKKKKKGNKKSVILATTKRNVRRNNIIDLGSAGSNLQNILL